MKNLNQKQILGIVILLLGITASFLTDNSLVEVPSGVAAAVGVSLIFQWIPYKRSNSEK